MNFYNNPIIQQRLIDAERTVLAGQQTSFTAAQSLLDDYFNSMTHATD
jgi:LAO/AO transport system kinase